MPIDYSVFKLAKPRPRILEKREQKAKLKTEDDRQREICHARSGLRCEVQEVIPRPEHSLFFLKRCKGRVVHNHHLIGGNGRRNVGKSILAEHRMDTCQKCHQDIEGGILVPADQDYAEIAAKVTYCRRAW